MTLTIERTKEKMEVGNELTSYLKEKARYLRRRGIGINARTLHAGSALSSADIIAVLFYHVLKIDPKNPQWEERDVFINSRGHACEPIFVAMADLGFFPEEDLDRAEEGGSHLHGLTATTTPGIEYSCGSLGQGLSLGVGTALAHRALKKPGRVIVTTGDGEWQEGSGWESAMCAAHYKLDNLTVIIDRNAFQSSDRGTENVMSMEPMHEKFKAFNWGVRRIDGHSIEALVEATASLPLEPGKPSMIIADTIKGKGVSFLEGEHNHCGRFGRDKDPAMFALALQELQDAT